MLEADVDFVCIATPDNRHFAAARAALAAGKHVLIEKPSVLSLAELDELTRLAEQQRVLAKVVYHKLLDPDHKKLRTLVADGLLRHVNNGYCSLLEPKAISGAQFSEWINGRNPGTYVAVHYIKLIDFTFGGRLTSISCSGQRGLVGPADGSTWDSTQLRLAYRYDDGREAAFDIHTSWVTPDNFPGHVEQEVQFRFDNGVWNGHSRKRGVECTIEGRTPLQNKVTLNNHYAPASSNQTANDPSEVTVWRCCSDSPAKWPRWSSAARPLTETSAGSRYEPWITMTCPLIGRWWRPCKRLRPSFSGMRLAWPTAWSRSIGRRADWCCASPAAAPACCTRLKCKPHLPRVSIGMPAGRCLMIRPHASRPAADSRRRNPSI